MTEFKALIEGYREFYHKYFASSNTLYKDLTTTGQSPKTVIIACSDSRADPSIITSANPGDIFVIRNVANLVPPYEVDDSGLHGVSAALEFAVCILKVKHIIILGHSNCAGIKSLLSDDDIENTDFIGKWVSVAQSAKDKTIANSPNANENDLQHGCEKESILLSLDNILTFPWVKQRVTQNVLQLHGWYFSLEDGFLQEYNLDKAEFERISVTQN